MKKAFLLPLGIIALLSLAFINPPGSLTGRWQKRLPNGVLLGAVFRADSSYDGFANGKTFVSGTYYVRQDTFALTDGGCGLNYYGTYKLRFPTADSIHFAAIQDTCGERRNGTDGLMFGRVKPGQTK